MQKMETPWAWPIDLELFPDVHICKQEENRWWITLDPFNEKHYRNDYWDRVLNDWNSHCGNGWFSSPEEALEEYLSYVESNDT